MTGFDRSIDSTTLIAEPPYPDLRLTRRTLNQLIGRIIYLLHGIFYDAYDANRKRLNSYAYAGLYANLLFAFSLARELVGTITFYTDNDKAIFLLQ